jgi:hypothetical protein
MVCSSVALSDPPSGILLANALDVDVALLIQHDRAAV